MCCCARSQELSEEQIRPRIIVDRRALEPQETKRRAFLRAGGDGLQTDDTSQSCENTVQGVTFITDALGGSDSAQSLDQQASRTTDRLAD